MKSRAAFVFLGLVLGVLLVSSALAETSKDAANGDVAKQVNDHGGGSSGGGYGGKCKYGYCCGRGYHGSCHKCCKSAEEAKLIGTETKTPNNDEADVEQAEQKAVDTTYYGGSGGHQGGGGWSGGGGYGGKCKYGYCCGRGYHGSCHKCCKNAEEAKLIGTEATTPNNDEAGVEQAEQKVADTTYYGGGGGNYGGWGGNYGGGGNYGRGGGGNYGRGGGYYGGGRGRCYYGCCGYSGGGSGWGGRGGGSGWSGRGGGCYRCCQSLQEYQTMLNEIKP